MSSKPNLPVAPRRPMAAQPRPTAAPPPPADEDEDIFGAAFTTETPPRATAPAIKRPTAVTRRDAELAEVAQEFGSKGAPPVVAEARGLKGSEVFGAPGDKSGPNTKVVGATQAPIAAKARGVGAPAPSRSPAAAPATETVSEQLAQNLEENGRAALNYLRESSSIPWANLTDQQKFNRDVCFQLLTNELAGMLTMARDIIVEQVDNLLNLTLAGAAAETTLAGGSVQANKMAEKAASLATKAARELPGATIGGARYPPIPITEADDPFGDAFEGGPQTGEVKVVASGTYLFPSSLPLSVDELAALIIRYSKAPLKAQGDIDRKLGLDRLEAPYSGIAAILGGSLKVIRSEAQEMTQQELAHNAALRVIGALFGTEPEPEGSGPEELGDGYDDEDGSEDDESVEEQAPVRELTYERSETSLPARGGRGVGQQAPPSLSEQARTRRVAYEVTKLALSNRAETLVCVRCKYDCKWHARLTGEVVRGGQQLCKGFVAENQGQADVLKELVRQTAAFKEEYGDLIEEDRAKLQAEKVRVPEQALKSPPAGGVREGHTVGAVPAEGSQGGSDTDPSRVNVQQRRDLPGAAGAGIARRTGSTAGTDWAVVGGKGQPSAGAPSLPVRAAPTAPPKSGAGGVEGVDRGRQSGTDPRRIPERRADVEQRVSGGDEARVGRASLIEQGFDPAGGEDAEGGADVSPAEYREGLEQQRRDWVKEAAPHLGDLPRRLLWGINYPRLVNGEKTPNHEVPYQLPHDSATTERRDRVTKWVSAVLDKWFFTPEGELHDDIEYGSTSWRVFVSAARLAKACEDYAAGRGGAGGDEEALKNVVTRHTKGFFEAHRAVEGAYDPDIYEYLEWLTAEQKPFGAAYEEGQQ
jgi:hypothetical protein